MTAIPPPPFSEQMHRWHSEIDRLVLAAEVACPYEQMLPNCPGCCFKSRWSDINQGKMCILPDLRELLGESRPTGLCPHGEEQGKGVLCRYDDQCDYQVFDTDTMYNAVPITYCGREAATLALSEEPEEAEGLK